MSEPERPDRPGAQLEEHHDPLTCELTKVGVVPAHLSPDVVFVDGQALLQAKSGNGPGAFVEQAGAGGAAVSLDVQGQGIGADNHWLGLELSRTLVPGRGCA